MAQVLVDADELEALRRVVRGIWKSERQYMAFNGASAFIGALFVAAGICDQNAQSPNLTSFGRRALELP